MYITNQGKITLNKPLTQEAIDAISNADVRFAGKTYSDVGDSEIYVEDFCDSDFEGTVNYHAPKGTWLPLNSLPD